MKTFIGENFLLKNETARRLYVEYAQNTPIIDYHCHIPPKDIADDHRFETISEAWLGGDHYKWRLMRAFGVPYDDIGAMVKSDPFRVFADYARVLSFSPANPLYHWSHLELKRYFGIDECLTADSAKYIFDECNKLLQKPEYGARGFISRSNVAALCTTDDPLDDLAYHERIAADESVKFKVLPAFRPDKALAVEAKDFKDYAAKFGAESFKELKDALSARVDYFCAHGAKASDHCFPSGFYNPVAEPEVEKIFRKALRGEEISEFERTGYKTALMGALFEKYRERGMVCEIHFGVTRNNNSKIFGSVGADAGCDAIWDVTRPALFAPLLDAANSAGNLPKTILFSLNPNDGGILAGVAGCFRAVQVGAAWWFNDTKSGMEKLLTDLADYGLLSGFVGMLTDSRSLLSYPRHEYFRRILCGFLGAAVEAGEYPEDMVTLGELVGNICYNNAARFFGVGNKGSKI